MYAPPRDIQSSVFTRLPEHFRSPRTSSEWTRFERPGAAVHSFLEGPSFDREGRLYCVDIAFGRVFRISASGDWELATEYDGEPTGLKIHRDGRIFIADNRRGILQLHPDTGAITPFLERHDLEPIGGCNDLIFASNGDLYFTAPGQSSLSQPTGRLYRVTPEGQSSLLLDRIPYPNGLVLNRTESALYLAVTYANAIWNVPLGGTRMQAGGVGVFIHLSGGLGPDGLALDVDGNLAVAQARQGSVWLFSPLGEPLIRIRSAAGLSVTNLAYGGQGNASLYITEAETGSILVANLPIAGRDMYSNSVQSEYASIRN